VSHRCPRHAGATGRAVRGVPELPDAHAARREPAEPALPALQWDLQGRLGGVVHRGAALDRQRRRALGRRAIAELTRTVRAPAVRGSARFRGTERRESGRNAGTWSAPRLGLPAAVSPQKPPGSATTSVKGRGAGSLPSGWTCRRMSCLPAAPECLTSTSTPAPRRSGHRCGLRYRDAWRSPGERAAVSCVALLRQGARKPRSSPL
jgi:hypothetical protein